MVLACYPEVANIGRRPHSEGPEILEAATTAAMRTLYSLEGPVIAGFDLILWHNSVRFPRSPSLAVSRQMLSMILMFRHQVFLQELVFCFNSDFIFCYCMFYTSCQHLLCDYYRLYAWHHLCSLTFASTPKLRLLQYFTSPQVDKPSFELGSKH